MNVQRPGQPAPARWRHPYAAVAAGVAALCLLAAAFTVPRTVSAIELDIGARVAAATARHSGEVRARVRHQDVTLLGVVPDDDTRAGIVRDVADLRGVRSVTDQMTLAARDAVRATPAAYLFDAVREAERVVLSGFVPDDTRRASLVGLARATFAPLRVVDRLALAPNAPANFDAAVKSGLQQLAVLENGSLRFNGRRALLEGVVSSAEQRAAIERSVADKADAPLLRLRYPDAERARRGECQTQMAATLAAAELKFATGSDQLRPGSEVGLDRVAAILRRCDGLIVQVEGHTDSAGVAAQNLALSERRAQAVAAAFVERGVPEDRLRPTGFGDQRPVGDNATRAGRKANRRIELVVVD